MRCSLGKETILRKLVLAIVLAGLATFSLSASAQAEEEAATSEPNLQEPAPSSEPATEEPALQLKLDDTGVGVTPSPPGTADGYTLEEMDVRVRRARIGVGVSVIAMTGGLMMSARGMGEIAFQCFLVCEPLPNWVRPVAAFGMILSIGGFVGTVVTSIALRRRKRDRDRLQQAHYGRPHRVQWDLARSRVVF